MDAAAHRHPRRPRAADRTVARRSALLILPLALLVLVLLAGYLYDHSRRDVIAKGVSAAGVPLGGLTGDQAFMRLRDRVDAQLSRPVAVTAEGHSFELSPQAAGVSVDLRAIAQEAVSVSRRGSIVTRVVRGLTGGTVNRDLPLRISYSHAAVRGLIATITHTVNRPAQDATVQPSAGGLTQVGSHPGRAVNATVLAAGVEHALANPNVPHAIVAPMRTIEPRVTTAALAAKYPAYIIVDRHAHELRFYERLKLANTYPIAVGRQGLETPAGLYDVQWKQTNPSWYVPNSSWAGALAGKVIPPGPQDPIKARWMAFNGGAGIHGIDPSEYSTIGHDASHGCVRMRIPDVIALYSRSPVGTPVYVA